MPISLDEKIKLFLVHVPKTAGTSICFALNLEISARQHQTWKAVPDDYISFSVVRDPVDRFKSCVRFALSEKTYWHDSKATPHIDREKVLDMSISEIINDLRDPYEQRNLKHVGWVEQNFWLFDQKVQKVDHIFGVTKLEENLNTMLRSHNIPEIDLPIVNQSEQMDITLSEEDILRIQSLYAEDYALLGRYF